MKRTFFLFTRQLVTITLVVWFGCAGTLPPPKPLDSERAAIGIAVKLRAPVRIFSRKPNVVYFIKLDEVDSLAAANYQVPSHQITQSSYSKDGQFYLLNALPGRYAVVASFEVEELRPDPPSAPSGSGLSISFDLDSNELKYTAFFSKDIIKLTEVTVAPGAIVFMGNYVIDESYGLKGADEAQAYYCNLITPGANTSLLGAAFTGKSYYKGSLHEHQRDPQTEMNFLIKAQEYLQGAGWENLIQRRMDELKAQTPDKIITQKKGGIQ